jgi:hypothetical protein
VRTDDWQTFKKAINCHICNTELGKDRVRDHCHVTENLEDYKFTGRIPVVFHNLRGYDNHVIMQAIGKIQGKSLKCIPNNIEKYTLGHKLGATKFEMENIFYIALFSC